MEKLSKMTIYYDDENIINSVSKIDQLFLNLHRYNKGILYENKENM